MLSCCFFVNEHGCRQTHTLSYLKFAYITFLFMYKHVKTWHALLIKCLGIWIGPIIHLLVVIAYPILQLKKRILQMSQLTAMKTIYIFCHKTYFIIWNEKYLYLMSVKPQLRCNWLLCRKVFFCCCNLNS